MRAWKRLGFLACLVLSAGCGSGMAPEVKPLGPDPNSEEFKKATRTADSDPTFKGQRFEPGGSEYNKKAAGSGS